MKNSVSVVLYMPYEDLEFDGLRKALEFAIESKREADILFNGELVWQSYNGSKKIEAAISDALEVMHRYTVEDNPILHFRNSNIVKFGNVYAKKIGETFYDDDGIEFDVCCVYSDIDGNIFGYDPYFGSYVDIERVNLRRMFNERDLQPKKRGRRSNSRNKQQARNKKLHAGFVQIEEDDLPF